ncbi:transcriptional regulator [Chlorella sorokiniana]|uniref:Transcriptional regulator n=1 Tax=Chlorella sorokiniana TaxID=3076 RepID=A0A2P6TEK5_CHLSO|nr:transcriptional regulator [Chlorella sorokiniana]|eukprot:PRW21076.1 transcriptional regulator [Chlorella sorokiniana]
MVRSLAAEAEACASQLASSYAPRSDVQDQRQTAELHGRLESLARQLELPLLRSLATALLEFWRRPEAAEVGQVELAQAAAARSCAYLGCSNLELEGGPAAGEGAGAKRCSAECAKANWREGGHREACAALRAARREERAQQRRQQEETQDGQEC